MKILLGVCGSVAAYRSIDVARELGKLGHEVKVVLTAGALKFIRLELFGYLGIEAFGPKADFTSKGVLHIELIRWAEHVVLLPLSAQTLNKVAQGLANDLLTTMILARSPELPVSVFPAMNPQMWHNHLVQKHLSDIKTWPHWQVFQPQSGEMICGEMGVGKLPAAAELVDHIDALPSIFKQTTSRQKILITTGATLSYLDPIRYLTNGSTGLVGLELAKAFARANYQVEVIATVTSTKRLKHLAGHHNINVHLVATAEEMLQLALEQLPDTQLVVASAAVNDLRFKEESQVKIAKKNLPGTLTLEDNPDILAQLLARKKDHQTFIGFAAQSPLTWEFLKEKWQRKPVDLLVGNEVSMPNAQRPGSGFDEGVFTYYLLGAQGQQQVERFNKRNLANYLVDWYQHVR